MDQRLVSSRQFKKKDGTWVREITVDAADKKTGMTAEEIRDILASCPPNMYPQFFVRVAGQVKQIKFRVEMAEGEA